MEEIGQKLARYWQVLYLIEQKSTKTPVYFKNSHFKTALMSFISHKLVNTELFLVKLELKLETLRSATCQLSYTAQFVNIYNYHNKDKIDLASVIDDEIKEEIIQQYMMI